MDDPVLIAAGEASRRQFAIEQRDSLRKLSALIHDNRHLSDAALAELLWIWFGQDPVLSDVA